MDANRVRAEIHKIAAANGVDEIRFTDAGDFEPYDVFHGRQPADVLAGAKSIVVCSAYIGPFYLPEWSGDSHAKTSRLTLSGFYYNLVEPLLPVADYLAGQGFNAVISDGEAGTGDIPLKPAAVRAGLGWIGKNSLLINEKYGSWQAIGAIITDADLGEPNRAAADRCGTCGRCAAACPMEALARPYALDRGKCLSDLLESASLDDAVLKAANGYIFECDICQNACPWNRKHAAAPLPVAGRNSFDSRDAMAGLLDFRQLLSLDEDSYNATIIKALPGIGLTYAEFRRNLAAAADTIHGARR